MMLGCKNMSEMEVYFKSAPGYWCHLNTPVRRLYYSVLANHIASKQVVGVFRVTNGAQVDSCSFTVPNIILIIGESYGKAHSALYGYEIPTTPRQSDLREKGELVAFDDVVTNKNLTSFVFKNMLTTYVVGDKGTWSDTPLFPAIFRKAGYNVTFLSNEFTSEPKANDAVWDVSGGFFLNQKDMSHLLFDYRNEKIFPYDEDLLDAYDRRFKKTERKNNLTIFHLIGQHMNYNQRYPENRAHFSAKDYTRFRPELTEEQRQAVAEYDNATLYNDSIVCEIIKRYSTKDAIVIYVPDHGEECYEGTRGYICRNPYPQMDWPKAHYEYEIPFWIYCSPKFRENHAELYQQIKEAKSRKFMTDALPHLLMYLGGIKTKWYNEKYNLISPHYWNDRPRMIDDAKYDYDKLRKDRK